ncbi:MAG: site-specific integrase [Bacteroidales bacterium]|nr:site-specific integrase [Bacteroidales bacterium]
MPKIKSAKLKEPVRVRTKKLSDGSQSIYLDIYVNGTRSYEFLKMYLLPEINGRVKEQNRATLAAAEAIKSQRIIDITNSKAGIKRAKGWQRLLLSDWLELYVEKKKEEGKKKISAYRSIVKVISPFVGKCRMGDIDKKWAILFIDWIQNTYRSANGQALSRGTAFFYVSKLSNALNDAVRAEKLGENPFMLLSSAERIKKPESQRQYLTVEEVKRLIATECRDQTVKMAYLFSCYTSLRISDIRAMRWKNIVCNNGNYMLSFIMRKTSKPTYTPLSVNAMLWLPERSGEDEEALVFGDLPSAPTISEILNDWAKDAKIDKHVTYHTSRHTFGTMMLTAGADLYTTSKLMGHADVRTTQIYAKIIDSKKIEAVNLVDKMFEGK